MDRPRHDRRAIRRLVIAIGVALAWSIAAAQPVVAQSNRTFVSGHGDDGNNCSLALPCRSFQHAHDLTNAGGEITVLDPAGYGPVNITKALSIVNDGVGEAGVTVTTSTDAIDINAGASDVINLIGLTLVGNFGKSGITFFSGNTLNVQNCVIRGFSNEGFAAFGGVNVNISDTVVSNNSDGILLARSGSGHSAFLNRVQVQLADLSGGSAFDIEETGTVTISNSSGSGRAGVGLFAANAVPVVIMVGSRIFDTSLGVQLIGQGHVYLARSTISGNFTAFFQEGSDGLQSYGDNYIVGNANLGAAPTPVATR